MLDIDYFKKFNDTYRHLFGDEVLKHLARYFKDNIRNTDYIGKYGGEEFMLFFPYATNESIYPRLDKIREGLSKLPVSMEIDGQVQTAYVTASFGMAEYSIHGQTVQELIEIADKALYHSKEIGRDLLII